MNYVNNVTNFASWITSPLWSRCSKKASDKTELAAAATFTHSGGGAALLPVTSVHISTGGSSSAAAAAAQIQPASSTPQPTNEFIARIWKFFGRATSASVPLKSDTSWLGLTDGKTFQYKGITYRICPTIGDGACAIHAILGQKITSGGFAGEYGCAPGQFSWDIARITYVDQLRSILKQGETAQPVQMLEGFLSDRFLDIITPSPTQTAENKALKSRILAMSPQLSWFSSWVLRNKAFFEKLKAETKQLELEVGKGKRPAKDLETLKLKYAKDPIAQEAYLQTCLQQDHYFTDQEIAIMAELFDKKITVFGQTTGGTTPVIYNSSAKNEVLIHFRGNPSGHYSRVEIVL